MASLSAALDTFLIQDPERSRTTGNVFVASAEEAEREHLGRLFIVSELGPSHPDNLDIIHRLQETVRHAYYRQTDRGFETGFEMALTEANATLQDLLQADERNWLPGLNTFIGVIRDNQFVYAHLGTIQGFLIRGNRILDLVHESGVEAPVNPLKIFSTVVSGQIESNDRLLVATMSLLDYYSQEKLRRMVTGGSPEEVVATLDQFLRDNPTQTSFAGLIVHLQSGQEPTAAPRPTGTLPSTGPNRTLASMEQLIHREQATKELLTPSLWRSLTLLSKSGVARVEDTIRTRFLRKPARRRLSAWQAQPRPRSLIVTGLLAIGSLIRKLLSLTLALLIAGIVSLVRLLRRPAGARERPSIAGWLDRLIWTVQRMNRRQRHILGLTLLAVLVMTQGVWLTASRRSTSLSSAERQEIERSIEEQTEQVTTRLSYGDEQGARKLIAEVEGLIARLPAKRKSDRQRVEDFRSKLKEPKEKTNRLRHPTLVPYASLANVTAGEPEQLVRVNDQLLVVTSTGAVLQVTEAEQSTVLAEPDDPFQPIEATVDGSALLIRNAGSLVRFDPQAKTFAGQTIVLPNQPLAMATFRQRLYLADGATDQILRFTRAGAGYGAGQPWLAEPSREIDRVRSLAIDGNVWLLTDEGKLFGFSQGAPQALTVDPVDPSLADATNLWTAPDSQALYLLNPGTGRMVVFAKNGRLEAQYQDDRLTGSRGFAVDEKGQRLYVLTPSQVLTFELKITSG